MYQTTKPRLATSRGTGWLGLLTAVTTLITFGVAYTTPPRSGPFCTTGCVPAPYTDAAQFVPRDYIWLYPALAVTLLFVAVLVAVEAQAGAGRRILGRTSVAVATLAATALVIDYGVQLTVVQPLVARGEAGGIGFLTQYHPEGLFIGLEDIGYTAMALAFVLAGLAVVPAHPLDGVLRWTLVLGGLATMVALVVLAAVYGSELDYRYEVAAISLTWLTLVVAACVIAWQHLRGGRPRAARRDLR